MSQGLGQYEREQREMYAAAQEYLFREKIVKKLTPLRERVSKFIEKYEREMREIREVFDEYGEENAFVVYYENYTQEFLDELNYFYVTYNEIFDEIDLDLIANTLCKEKLDAVFPEWTGVKAGLFQLMRFFLLEVRNYEDRDINPEMRDEEYTEPDFDEDKLDTMTQAQSLVNNFLRLLDEIIFCVKEPMGMLQANATKYMRTGFYNYGSGRFSQADQDRKKGRANVFVLTCIDPRYITDVFEFLLKDKKLHANFDLFTLAGASAGVMETEWDKAFLENLGLGIQLHGIKEVWCFDHLDCGMYKATFGLEKDDDPAIHLETMAKLKEYLQQKFPQLTFRKFIVGQDGEVMKFGGVKPPRVNAPKEYVKVNNVRRNRFEAPQEIVRQALQDVEKISKIPYKKMSEKKSKFFFWGENPVKDVPAVLIDLPIIEVETLRKRDVRKDVIFHTLESMKKEGFKMFNKGCIVVHNGEILTIYITGKDDKALSESAKHLYDLGKQFTEYYPRKEATFYTHDKILLKGNPTLKEKRAFKKNMSKVEKTDRYYGFNALDGQIKYYSAPNHSAVIDYHPRKPEASFDEKFLYNLIFSYASLYMLEERYAPAVAKYRLMKAEQVEKAEAIPGVPLKDLPATSLGMSENFASALHDDSGIKGITESIMWSKVGQDKESYFVNDQTKMAFDLSDENSMILIPPKVSHGTANTGEHGGFGFVIITKANLVFNTPLNKEWHSAWNGYLGTSLAKERFTSSRKG
jgi:carbonic anhydrase